VYIILLVFKRQNAVGILTITPTGIEVFIPHNIKVPHVVSIISTTWNITTINIYKFPSGFVSGNFWCLWFLYYKVTKGFDDLQKLLTRGNISTINDELYPLIFTYSRFITDCLKYNKTNLYKQYFSTDSETAITENVDDLASSLIGFFKICKPKSTTWDQWMKNYSSKMKTVTEWPDGVDANTWKGLIHTGEFASTFCF
jgi:hypothetical protein